MSTIESSKTCSHWQRVEGGFFRTKIKKNNAAEECFYKLGRLIGSGLEGEVYELCSEGKTTKAIKVIPSDHGYNRSDALIAIGKERRSLTVLNEVCPHYHHYLKSPTLYHAVIVRRLDATLSERAAHLSFWELLETVELLAQQLTQIHRAGIAHRDIHSDNIMYRAKDNTYSFIDFSGSKMKNDCEEGEFNWLCLSDIKFLTSAVSMFMQRHYDSDKFQNRRDMLAAARHIWDISTLSESDHSDHLFEENDEMALLEPSIQDSFTVMTAFQERISAFKSTYAHVLGPKSDSCCHLL
ncbi:MAG: hypothetical protein K2P51_01505 [Rhabdochlamydiaceae bacterium]|nr:hypothetical protein [Rhabdochlamydiaceae bacterium]